VVRLNDGKKKSGVGFAKNIRQSVASSGKNSGKQRQGG
jgi:hypothetical protein